MTQARALDVLFVEDSENDAKLVARALEQCGYTPTWERVETADALRAAFERRRWNVVISDSNVPGLNLFEALAGVQHFAAGVPFIIVSGVITDDRAREAVHRGAASWISKDELERLGEILERVLVGPDEDADDRFVRTLAEVRRLVELARDERGAARAHALERALVAIDDAIRQAGALAGGESPRPLESRAEPDLTPRQREVLELIAEGHATSEIARRLRISVKTVESHRAQIMERLGIRHVPGLVRYAIRHGIVADD